MSSIVDFVLCAAGPKGADFTLGILEKGYRPSVIYTYSQAGDSSASHESIILACERARVSVVIDSRPDLSSARLALLVGWQFLIKKGIENCIVLHDSLLPRYSGYAPTVTALLAGADRIGVTALKPDEGIDTGPIIAQLSEQIPPNTKVGDALQLIVSLMLRLTENILRLATEGNIPSVPQNDAERSYSIWRDRFDYFVDWRMTSEIIANHIRALGPPYDGAKAVLQDGTVIRILEAEVIEDIKFEIRDPGKVWDLNSTDVDVVCGQGMIRIKSLTLEGAAFSIRKKRTRFLTADNAWIRGLEIR
jgi:methionyl-tRNA formyltransferase